jgi:CRP-like cAMP-binding protein
MGKAMSDDLYVDSIDRVEAAANELLESIVRMVEHLGRARRERLAGVDLVSVIRDLVAQGGRQRRLAPTMAFRKLEQAITAYRAIAIRELVDEQHMTFSQIGELTGVSRQMIARLYRQTESSDEVDGVIRSKRQRVAHHDRDLGASS